MTDAVTMPSSLSYNDKQHAYWIDGARAKGVTTMAKTLESSFAIEQWRKRALVVGMARRPDLVERAAAHYDERDLLEEIAEEAMTAAGTANAAKRGSAAHRITERHDLTETLIDTPYSRQVVAAWEKALDDAGLVMLPQYVERIVVYPGPDLLIAGTFDRIARRKISGELVIVDLKTGVNAIKYPHSMAIQLALYANAPLIAGKIAPGGGSTTEFAPMPKVNRRIGYIVHMPEGEETVQVRTVDIAAGWEVARNLIFPTFAWRDRTDLVGEVQAESSVTPLTDNIKGRLAVLKMLERADEAKAMVATSWPTDVPFRPPWTVEQGEAIVSVLTRVELAVGAHF